MDFSQALMAELKLNTSSAFLACGDESFFLDVHGYSGILMDN